MMRQQTRRNPAGSTPENHEEKIFRKEAVLSSLLFFMEEHENKKVGNDNIESGKQVKNPFRKGVV